MKKIVLINQVSGLVIQVFTPGDTSNYIDGDTTSGFLTKVIEGDTTAQALMDSYYKDAFYPLPERPSTWHQFDLATEGWVISEEALLAFKTRKQNEVEGFRYSKANEAIMSEGICIDGDELAKTNLNGKILEVTANIEWGIPMAELFWKDISNTVHTWESMPAYLLWLRKTATALSARTTALYIVAWGKKSDVAALTTFEAIASYDITIGW